MNTSPPKNGEPIIIDDEPKLKIRLLPKLKKRKAVTPDEPHEKTCKIILEESAQEADIITDVSNREMDNCVYHIIDDEPKIKINLLSRNIDRRFPISNKSDVIENICRNTIDKAVGISQPKIKIHQHLVIKENISNHESVEPIVIPDEPKLKIRLLPKREKRKSFTPDEPNEKKCKIILEGSAQEANIITDVFSRAKDNCVYQIIDDEPKIRINLLSSKIDKSFPTSNKIESACDNTTKKTVGVKKPKNEIHQHWVIGWPNKELNLIEKVRDSVKQKSNIESFPKDTLPFSDTFQKCDEEPTIKRQTNIELSKNEKQAPKYVGRSLFDDNSRSATNETYCKKNYSIKDQDCFKSYYESIHDVQVSKAKTGNNSELSEGESTKEMFKQAQKISPKSTDNLIKKSCDLDMLENYVALAIKNGSVETSGLPELQYNTEVLENLVALQAADNLIQNASDQLNLMENSEEKNEAAINEKHNSINKSDCSSQMIIIDDEPKIKVNLLSKRNKTTVNNFKISKKASQTKDFICSSNFVEEQSKDLLDTFSNLEKQYNVLNTILPEVYGGHKHSHEPMPSIEADEDNETNEETYNNVNFRHESFQEISDCLQNCEEDGLRRDITHTIFSKDEGLEADFFETVEGGLNKNTGNRVVLQKNPKVLHNPTEDIHTTAAERKIHDKFNQQNIQTKNQHDFIVQTSCGELDSELLMPEEIQIKDKSDIVHNKRKISSSIEHDVSSNIIAIDEETNDFVEEQNKDILDSFSNLEKQYDILNNILPEVYGNCECSYEPMTTIEPDKDNNTRTNANEETYNNTRVRHESFQEITDCQQKKHCDTKEGFGTDTDFEDHCSNDEGFKEVECFETVNNGENEDTESRVVLQYNQTALDNPKDDIHTIAADKLDEQNIQTKNQNHFMIQSSCGELESELLMPEEIEIKANMMLNKSSSIEREFSSNIIVIDEPKIKINLLTSRKKFQSTFHFESSKSVLENVANCKNEDLIEESVGDKCITASSKLPRESKEIKEEKRKLGNEKLGSGSDMIVIDEEQKIKINFLSRGTKKSQSTFHLETTESVLENVANRKNEGLIKESVGDKCIIASSKLSKDSKENKEERRKLGNEKLGSGSDTIVIDEEQRIKVNFLSRGTKKSQSTFHLETTESVLENVANKKNEDLIEESVGDKRIITSSKLSKDSKENKEERRKLGNEKLGSGSDTIVIDEEQRIKINFLSRGTKKSQSTFHLETTESLLENVANRKNEDFIEESVDSKENKEERRKVGNEKLGSGSDTIVIDEEQKIKINFLSRGTRKSQSTFDLETTESVLENVANSKNEDLIEESVGDKCITASSKLSKGSKENKEERRILDNEKLGSGSDTIVIDEEQRIKINFLSRGTKKSQSTFHLETTESVLENVANSKNEDLIEESDNKEERRKLDNEKVGSGSDTIVIDEEQPIKINFLSRGTKKSQSTFHLETTESVLENVANSKNEDVIEESVGDKCIAVFSNLSKGSKDNKEERRKLDNEKVGSGSDTIVIDEEQNIKFNFLPRRKKKISTVLTFINDASRNKKKGTTRNTVIQIKWSILKTEDSSINQKIMTFRFFGLTLRYDSITVYAKMMASSDLIANNN
nr:unnamed protein product [Callosobruchus analis]